MRKTLTISVIALLLAGSVAWAVGPKHDTFSVTLYGDNWLFEGDGTGWSPAGGPGEWIHYDQVQPDWWNQWFYNDPPDGTRWKEISYDISIDAFVGDGFSDTFVEVALNWSTVDFPETGPGGPPPMPEQEQFIERHVIYSGPGLAESIVGDYVIPDYNPEWVSIDVWVDAWAEIEIGGDPDGGPDGGPDGNPPEFDWVPVDVQISGDIWHECVPEPATLGLLMIGGLVLLGCKRSA